MFIRGTYYAKEEIRKCIIDVVKEVTHQEIENENLLDSRLGIQPVDFLYIFDLLEKELKLPVIKIIEVSDYNVMQIDRLCDAIWNLQKKK